MKLEDLDIKKIMETRRHTVKNSLTTISVAELNNLAEELFPYESHPWLEKFREVANDHDSGLLHHARADDHVHVLYCHDKNIGMWFIRGSGKGPLQPDQLGIMRRIVEESYYPNQHS